MEVYKASFAGGEVSPEIAARADLEKYSVFSSICYNMIVQQQGGIKRRPGTVYMGECGSGNTEKRLIPFIISVEECYALEFGAGYMRAYTSAGAVMTAGGVPFELSTGLAADDVRQMSYTQVKDSLIIVDGKHIKEITRTSGTYITFSIKDYEPKYGPFMNEAEADAPQGFITKESSLLYLNTGTDTFAQSDVNKQYRLKVYIDGGKITYSGSNMADLKNMRVVCYSSWALRIKTGWAGAIRFEYSEDGENWNTHRTLATANNNTEWNITGSFAAEEQPVFVRFNGVDGNVSGTVDLAFETTGFWYYLIMDVKAVVNARKAKIDFVDVPPLMYDYLPALTYSQQWSFPEIEGYSSAASEVRSGDSIITATQGGSALAAELWKLRDGDTDSYCSFGTVSETAIKLVFKPYDLVSGGVLSWKIGGSFKYGTSADTFTATALNITFKGKKEDGTYTTLASVSVDSSKYSKEAGTNEYSVAAFTMSSNLSMGYPGIVFSQIEADIVSVGGVFDFVLDIYDVALDSYTRKSWEIGRPAWTSSNGMPRAVAQFQQRLVFGGTETEPDVIWATETGEKYSFFKNVEPKSADSITTSVIDNKASKILALSSLRSLLVFCMGAEFCLASDVFTPSAAGFNKQSEFGFLENGCFEVVGNRIIFPQNMGKVLRGFAYDYANDNYSGQDISIYVKHFFKNARIRGLAYQQEPNTTLWVVLDNGELLSCTYLEEQNVLAWARQDIGGKALNICSIYGEGQNDVFLIVQRKIGGTDRYFVEKLAKDNGDIQTSCYLDCAYMYSDTETAITQFTAAQFAGRETIAVLADGKYLPDIPLNSAGTADISGAMPEGAKNIIAGLPFVSMVRTLPINTDSQNVLLNKKIRFPYVDVCLLDSVECDVGFAGHKRERILPVFIDYNKCPELQSGWKRVPLNASNELGACAEIGIVKPYPLNVLGLIIEAV